MSSSAIIAKSSVKDLIAHISSGDVSPGAGSAGAVALALAAACAAKAVSVTLKHVPHELRLHSSLACFTEVARLALVDADRDSDAFEAFIRSRSLGRVARLVCEGERVAHLIAALGCAIDEIEPLIRMSVIGDLVAARALLGAARQIQENDEREARQNR